jgi:hypothetical protein
VTKTVASGESQWLEAWLIFRLPIFDSESGSADLFCRSAAFGVIDN